MYSRGDIYNLALDRIGSTVEVRSEGDDTVEFRVCEREYPVALARVLNLHPWTCCLKRASLPRLLEAPAFGWKYAFALPQDYVRMFYVDNYISCQLEGGNILTNEKDCRIVYVSGAVTPGNLASHVVDLLVLELAKRIVAPLTSSGTQKIQQMLQEMWQDAFPAAMAAEVHSSFNRKKGSLFGEARSTLRGVLE